MRMGIWVLMGMMAAGARAQTLAEQEAAIRTQVVGKDLVLRGFSGDSEVRLFWNGTKFDSREPSVRTVGIWLIDTVRLSAGRLEMEGTRRTLLRAQDKSFVAGTETVPVRLVIDRGGAELGVLPNLREALFYAGPAEAVKDLPRDFQKMLPTGESRVSCCEAVTPMACDCADKTPDCVKVADPGWKPPKLVKHVEPEFPRAMVGQRTEAYVYVAMMVGVDGRTSDFWLGRQAGRGFDEQSVLAASQYRFKPATCHGQPAPTSLAITMSFTSFGPH